VVESWEEYRETSSASTCSRTTTTTYYYHQYQLPLPELDRGASASSSAHHPLTSHDTIMIATMMGYMWDDGLLTRDGQKIKKLGVRLRCWKFRRPNT
jgi:hypothetical protein